MELLIRKESGGCVDSHLLSQIEEEEQNYCSALFKRIIKVIKFLPERGLVFRDSDEKIGSRG